MAFNNRYNGSGNNSADPLDDWIQQLVDLHDSDCPNPYRLLDQCSHCGKKPVDNHAYPDPWYRNEQRAAYPALEVNGPQSSGRPHGQHQAYPQASSRAHQQAYQRAHQHLPISQSTPVKSTQPGTASYGSHASYMGSMNTWHSGNASSAAGNGRLSHNLYPQPPSYPQYIPMNGGSSTWPTINGAGSSRPSAPASVSMSRASSQQTQAWGPVAHTPSTTQRYPQPGPAPPLPTSSTYLDSDVTQNPRNVQNWTQQPRVASDRSQQPLPPIPGSANINPQMPTPSTSSSSGRRVGSQMYDPSYDYPCQMCAKRFPTFEDARKHSDRYHRDDADRPHGCTFCSQRFNFPREVQRHVASVHDNDAPSYYCFQESCKYHLQGFTREDNRNRHERAVHGFDRRAPPSPL